MASNLPVRHSSRDDLESVGIDLVRSDQWWLESSDELRSSGISLSEHSHDFQHTDSDEQRNNDHSRGNESSSTEVREDLSLSRRRRNNVWRFRNIRRCVNATGRLPSNGNSSPPSLTRHTGTGLLSSSSRPNPPGPSIAHHHHRGPYYTIIRPTSRRTDVGVFHSIARLSSSSSSSDSIFMLFSARLPFDLIRLILSDVFILGKMSRRSLARDLRSPVQFSCSLHCSIDDDVSLHST